MLNPWIHNAFPRGACLLWNFDIKLLQSFQKLMFLVILPYLLLLPGHPYVDFAHLH